MTIGHSTHQLPEFMRLLQQNAITAVADVRSIPASRYAPQFNQRSLESALRDRGLKYVFLGEELGARTRDASCYVDGRVQYHRLAQTREFRLGIDRLERGAKTERIAIMCTEGDPLSCHRTVLVARVLSSRRLEVQHIHADGRIETHASAMKRLMAKFGLEQDELFRTSDERLAEALSRQESEIAYVSETPQLDRMADV
ncbi:DUF488 domain-containing protein [Streptomyces sp. R1]|uniref:DUF488 domain-containing protein n=1 Tax=unclassified Streptomyces TaxID=2593676 RepID=UPI0018F2B8A7|nr:MULTISPECIES: DUF488 domain-containing protein [unclassified Streptomyces]MCC8334830.1 DUF488 domain-containing protein [Streptomyces sp. R1]MDA4885857.1 DUF488 domain-containing protein [Streptomyces sp. MS2A]